MDGNTELIDLLVSNEAPASLKKLDAQIQGTVAEMGNLPGKVQELNVELSKAGKTRSELTPAMEKHARIEQEYIRLAEEEIRT